MITEVNRKKRDEIIITYSHQNFVPLVILRYKYDYQESGTKNEPIFERFCDNYLEGHYFSFNNFFFFLFFVTFISPLSSLYIKNFCFKET